MYVIRKKKSKSKSKPDNEKERERDRVKELLFKEDDAVKAGSSSSSSRNSPAVGSSSDNKTDAERRFEEVQKRRVSGSTKIGRSSRLIGALQLAAKVAKLAGKTHKDRVADFNNHLESLSEHHDIPKV